MVMRCCLRTGIACLLLILALSVSAIGQVTNGGAPANSAPKIDTQKYEDQVKQLMEQMQKPDFGLPAISARGCETSCSSFRKKPRTMDPQQVDQIRQPNDGTAAASHSAEHADDHSADAAGDGWIVSSSIGMYGRRIHGAATLASAVIDAQQVLAWRRAEGHAEDLAASSRVSPPHCKSEG